MPAGAVAYTVAAAILDELGAPDVVLLIAPLFVAGLCMAPFLIPFFDRMAKRDLAAHRASQADGSHDDVDRDDSPG